jgi:hypothetical protein
MATGVDRAAIGHSGCECAERARDCHDSLSRSAPATRVQPPGSEQDADHGTERRSGEKPEPVDHVDMGRLDYPVVGRRWPCIRSTAAMRPLIAETAEAAANFKGSAGNKSMGTRAR